MNQRLVLVTGATGFLGPWIVATLRRRGAAVCSVARGRADRIVDLRRPDAVADILAGVAPDAVIHAAALSRMGECQARPGDAQRLNAEVPAQLAARLGPRLLQVSTDLVFDGGAAPYGPGAVPSPRSVYAETKAEGEREVLSHGGRVVRLPLLFGPGGGATGMVRAGLAAGRLVTLFANEYRTPLHVADASRGLVDLALADTGPPITHLPGPERVSRFELGRRFCGLHGLSAELLRSEDCADPLRPADVSLCGDWDCGRSLDAALADA